MVWANCSYLLNPIEDIGINVVNIGNFIEKWADISNFPLVATIMIPSIRISILGKKIRFYQPISELSADLLADQERPSL